MDHFTNLENYYNKYVEDLTRWIPEGVTHVNLTLMHNLGLLKFDAILAQKDEEAFKGYFRVYEDPDKITLINDQFVIWITPQKVEEIPTTYTFIALNQPENPRLEVVLQSSGVYNSSRLVLMVLEKYLLEIQENENVLKDFREAS